MLGGKVSVNEALVPGVAVDPVGRVQPEIVPQFVAVTLTWPPEDGSPLGSTATEQLVGGGEPVGELQLTLRLPSELPTTLKLDPMHWYDVARADPGVSIQAAKTAAANTRTMD